MYRVFVWWCVVHVCVGSRILVVFPVPSPSHTALGDSVVKILLGGRHQVTYVTPFSSLPENVNLNKMNISSLMDAVPENAQLNIVELARNPRPPHKVLQVGSDFARRTLEHELVQRLMQDQEVTFDLVIAEWFFSGLLAPLASVFNCPLIWYSAVDASWMNLQLMHDQTNPAYNVDPHAKNWATGYSLRDRLDRLLSQAQLTAWFYYMTNYVESPLYYNIYTRALVLKDRRIHDFEGLMYNAFLMLVNSHPLLGQNLALPQNVKYVGGHHLDVPTKRLSKNLQNLLDTSEHGVILFSLGSKIPSKDLSERTKRRLLDIFGELQQTVIWKLEEPIQGMPRNVHIVKWAPRTSILSHNNTVLLISHGGFTSVLEATYFGVPVIGIPLFGDQYLTMDLVAARGRGVRLDLGEQMPYRLYLAIEEVLGNNSFKNKAKQASQIFQNSLAEPKQELLYWIQLILDHGGDHLLSPAVHLSIVQKLYLDAVGVVIMFLWFLTKVVKVIKAHWSDDDEVIGEVKKDQ